MGYYTKPFKKTWMFQLYWPDFNKFKGGLQIIAMTSLKIAKIGFGFSILGFGFALLNLRGTASEQQAKSE